MKKPIPLALALSLFGSLAATAHASSDNPLGPGLSMMQQNNILLRNGDNVWQRVREGFQLQEVNSDIVRRHERAYTARPANFLRITERSRQYLFHIMNEVERRGMPTEIALLPMVESAFQPGATSPVGAAGLWQFMPATGRQYGLEQTWWYDGRRDITAATRAALDYLENLYGMFGDWPLALAAYNWGEGNVSRALERNRARGLPEDYESINMPNETRNYVPKLIAIRNILRDPAHFGVALDKLPNKPYFVGVSTGKHIDLSIAAKLAEVSEQEFKSLNPGYHRPVFAYKSGRQLLVPASKADTFEKNLATWDKPLLTWQTIAAQEGDTVESLAARYGMNTQQLRAVNGVQGRLNPGQPLLVASSATAAAPALVASAAGSDLDGATSATPATPTGSTAPVPAVVASAAPTKAPVMTIAQAMPAVTLSTADAAGKAPEADIPATIATTTTASAGTHVVAAGDTLYNISRRYKLSVAELRAVNNLSDDAIHLGQSLQVAAHNDGDVVVRSADARQAGGLSKVSAAGRAREQEYVVQRGDTLFSIARKFGVEQNDLKRWNHDKKLVRLQPGYKVTLLLGN